MADGTFGTDTYVSELRVKREEKDDFFGSHPQLPIPPEERDDFDGLGYLDPGPDYRVTTLVETHANPEPVTVGTSTDGKVRCLRVATFHFELRDTGLILGAYRREHGDSPTLFVPLRDKTTGQQTYNDSRYIEFAPGAPLDGLEEVVVDFSLACNPFCAFIETFECPLPPEENWLGVVVPANEQDCE